MTKTSSFAALLLGGLLCSGSVYAQTASMQDRLERLESGVAALGQQGGRVEVAQAYPRTNSWNQTAQSAEMSPSLAADFEVRLQKLERAMSELTGRYEEATYQVSQLKDRLERINSDIDFRLKDLETKGSGGASDPFGGPKPSAAAPAGKGPEKVVDKAPEKPADKPTQTASVAPLPANASPDKQYEHAFELLRQSDYDKAEKAFSDFLAKNKGHQLAGNAQYWLGETYYVRNKFQDAAVAFAEGVQKYPKNSKAADNLLKLGMSLEQLNQKKDACTAFNQLINKFPEASASVKRRADTERRRINCPS
ncbi:tol-pal system protein YbgF [Azospirillum rugosum]|uniref:Cell division coordinator CpoB n=1 Tax=Azospirillum rugosum TaxID=416170 RepID=A0ABS4SH57_9PROT|nr:tol-pal system protein YbgF [Azospirillum rugosum]MBP2291900.1 tol-pal system protein YbgF [Azospirillum rugosum]MDQ0530896.1 tol-pal system protein YbgF [Azospirillum rugosum]